ncbi:hypothetical protein [Pseudaeromonas paramecii]|uniref:RelA/SpoT domain-containing protein n=1 Tax=Pseudaeromonas paramecii TaxID=2138166 RepID=A0ABP8QLB5_9GAMM
MMHSDFNYISSHIQRDIEHKLHAGGILCRVFGRGKSNISIEKKLQTTIIENDLQTLKYTNAGRKIQDAVGIRVVLYFSDDIEIVQNILNKHYNCLHEDSTIDKHEKEIFCVTRYNLIYTIPKLHNADFLHGVGGKAIDCTFEVQLRTVLSEGWHEVEHDLRYKQKQHWEGQNELSRSLNGILASLESSEWGMRKIFEELAYKHYKKKCWEAMLSLKFRLRIQGGLDENLNALLNGDTITAKKILKLDRSHFLYTYMDRYNTLPLTMDNIVYISNIITESSQAIMNITPSIIKNM